MPHTRRRLFVLVSLLAALGLMAVATRSAAATDFNVGADGMTAFTIGGVKNPRLTLTRGETYRFNINLLGHPLWITGAIGSASDAEANAFNAGVTNNGVSVGTLTFVVPGSAPSELYYQCGFHDTMGGTLTIVSPPAAVPSMGTWAAAGLGALLLLAGAVASTRLRRNPSHP